MIATRTNQRPRKMSVGRGPNLVHGGDRDRDALDNLEEVDREVIDAVLKIGARAERETVFGAVTERAVSVR